MAKHGGTRRNAGRKSKEAIYLDAIAHAKALQGWFTADVQESSWKSLVASEDENVRLKAISYLSDRLYGRPAQAVDMKLNAEVDITRVLKVS